jgi:hypothetical protein
MRSFAPLRMTMKMMQGDGSGRKASDWLKINRHREERSDVAISPLERGNICPITAV